MSQYWSKRTTELDPYIPGEQPKDTQYIKLNTNENPYPPSEFVLESIRKAADKNLRLYPDPDSSDLKQAIADYYGITVSQVFTGNGSDEVLAHTFVALLKQTRPLLYPDISYSFYPVYCKLFGINSVAVPLNADFQIDSNDYRQECGGIIFPNPNAPTGIALPLEDIEKMLRQHPEIVVVVDEAYIDFGGQTAVSLINQYENLLVIQTFSKSRSLAGLRVGFAIGSPILIEGLERVKNSFNSYPLARTAIAGATTAILDNKTFKENRNKIITTRELTTRALQDLGFSVLPSSANFIFAKPPEKISAETLYLKLKEQGVLIRYFKLPRISEYIRITIGTQQEMDTFLKKVDCLLK
jgi:histidinol-phosphate aminotransferase